MSPTAIAVVVLLHGAAITALVTAKMEMPPKRQFTPIQAYPVPVPPPPPRHPVKQPRREAGQDRVTTETAPFQIKDAPPPFVPPPPLGPSASARPGPVGPIEPPPLPKSDPVRTGPSIDPRSILQPPYPAALQREGVEGNVTVRVLIGADGRVRSVEKISASNDDFFLATERHALRSWRFRPATIDGRPVESSKVMVLRFQLDG